MPERRQAAAAANAPAQQGQQEEEGSSIFRSILNGIMIYLAIQFIMGQAGFNKDSVSKTPAPSFEERTKAAAPGTDGYDFQYIPEKIFPLWDVNTPLDITVYVSDSLILPPLHSAEAAQKRVFDAKRFVFSNSTDRRTVSVDIPKENLRWRNGSQIFAHVLVSKSGAPLDPAQPFDPASSYRFVRPLVKYMPKKKVVKTKNLLKGGEEEVSEEPVVEEKGQVVAPYWHANLTLEAISNAGVMEYRRLPPVIRAHVSLESTGARDATGRNGWYYPIIYTNEFWHLKEHMMEINSTVKSLPMHVDLKSSKFWKFQIFASLDESFKQAANNPNGLSSGGELEEFKRVLMDTNIYLLATTVVVSLLHTIFEMLAFKNDISHWKKKKDNVGVSVRTIVANVIMQTIIFLYLLDNNENTSWMILGGQGFGILLEAWKITKTVDIKITPAPGTLFGKKITFEDKHKLSQLEKETQEYDQIAFKYLYIVAVPLLIAYAIYSLVYETHKSWYSFIITTLVGSVYAYGFLMMVPSLYINYRLKSVAHMPRKAMMYKFLNTFIDDLFAFTIKMPTLHRLATLRDDVIFFVYLYQAYYYKTDYKRVNEFGQGGDDDEEDETEKKDEGKERKDEGEAKTIEDTPVEKAEATGAEKPKGKVRRR